MPAKTILVIKYDIPLIGCLANKSTKKVPNKFRNQLPRQISPHFLFSAEINSKFFYCK